jgi:hypothetical protein
LLAIYMQPHSLNCSLNKKQQNFRKYHKVHPGAAWTATLQASVPVQHSGPSRLGLRIRGTRVPQSRS